ncbi:MAG: 3-dehydroquinate synthase [Clostridia bacterium]|nr:3-dehydroquinate synthase [Clostridia bacterium]
MKTVSVRASRPYEVKIEAGLLARAGAEIAALYAPPRSVLIVTDDTVNALYADALTASLEKAGFGASRFVFAHGECSKHIGTLGEIWNTLAEHKLTRSDLIVALGGGVTGDMAGFAAATFLRGIAYIQIPTTLLAMVDSSVGGKTAIDLSVGKNLVGAFYQPSLVLCDTDLLATLSPEIYADGCAEVIKYGYINDPTLLGMLETSFADAPEAVIARCIADKRDLVEADEHDNGARQLLNLGHTAGHAIEACSNFEISHGSAVAIGMLLMARAAVKKGLCTPDVPAHMEAMLRAYHLPTDCPFGAADLAAVALSDKKRKGATLSLVVPQKLGQSVLYPIAAAEVEEFFAAGLN